MSAVTIRVAASGVRLRRAERGGRGGARAAASRTSDQTPGKTRRDLARVLTILREKAAQP